MIAAVQTGHLNLKPVVQVLFDTEAKALDGGEDVVAALQLLARQFGEPAFDLIDPQGRGRCEVNMPVRPSRQPRLDRRSLVGGACSNEARGDVERCEQRGRAVTLVVVYSVSFPRGRATTRSVTP